MTTRTRYFVIVSLLVLGVGVGTGLLAYYVGTGAPSSRGGPDELRFVPGNATLVAYANVQEVMTSGLRGKLREALPVKPEGQRELQNETGINIETDIDRVVACIAPPVDATSRPPATGLVLARGRFDQVKIEALMREHGAVAEDYRGARLIIAPAGTGGGQTGSPDGVRQHDALSVAFIEPGLVGLGSTPLVRHAIDLKAAGDTATANQDNITANQKMMDLVKSIESGNVWAVGRFDALTSQARLPGDLAGRLPPITWFSASGRVDGGLSGVLQAETRDDESAANLRDVTRGLLALAKMQAGSRPEMLALVQSLQLGGTGKTVTMSFDVPAGVFDLLGPALNRGRQNLPPLSPGK
jgi:hypothetical protein